MPWKQWARLEEVLADDLNLATRQAVIRFPTAAARDAAIPAPEDGQMAYLLDGHNLTVWDDGLKAWIPEPGHAIARASNTNTADAGIPALPSWQAVVTLPTATYYKGRTYRLTCSPIVVGNVTGSTRLIVFRWDRTGATIDQCANFSVPTASRMSIPVDSLWTPTDTYTGPVSLSATADASMGAGGNGNGMLTSSTPVRAAALYLGVVPGT
jgi:hypothetical protein